MKVLFQNFVGGVTMKLLTITIPSYNSEEYMEHAIQTALAGGKYVEILIVDDGSTDHTLDIAKKYEKTYPDIVRAIHKENGGHGSAVNTGIANASGMFFKVLDSDDWFDEESLKKVLRFIHYIAKNEIPLDLIITNYVYEKPSLNKQKIIRYKDSFTPNKFLTWQDARHFKMTNNLLMHSLMYRTEVLRESGLILPEHTFYVDNIFAFMPLNHAKKLCYLNVNLYRYYIGRDDQSVNESVMIKRIDQQIKITKIMIDDFDYDAIHSEKLRSYLLQYLSMMMIVSSVFLVIDGTEESLNKREELWDYLKNKSEKIYRIVSINKLGALLQFKTAPGRKVIEVGYKIMNKIFNFN